MLEQQNKQKFRICVSGAAETGHCGIDALDKAKNLGREIVKQDGILLTGATTGFPLWSAMGAKEEEGVSIGISPAASPKEHVDAYRLPLEYTDLIMYTGFGYAGRDLLLVRSSEAVIVGCGRVGTIHEFTVAFEDDKPIGVLEGDWEMDETIKRIIEKSNRKHEKIVFDADPKTLIKKIIALIEEDRGSDRETYSYRPAEDAAAKPEVRG
ncbi:hypothetical protein ACFL0K_00195 [Patescibacteria group bacterium]